MQEPGNEQFKHELQALTAKYITPASSFADYCAITDELTEEEHRLAEEAEKFPDDEVNASVTDPAPDDIKGNDHRNPRANSRPQFHSRHRPVR